MQQSPSGCAPQDGGWRTRLRLGTGENRIKTAIGKRERDIPLAQIVREQLQGDRTSWRSTNCHGITVIPSTAR